MTNLTKNIANIFLVLLCVIATPIYAQVIIDEGDGQQGASSSGFFGTFVSAIGGGSNHLVSYQALELGVDKRFAQDRGQFYFSGIAANSMVELDLELEGSVDQRDSEEREITLDIDENEFDIRDAFLQYDVGDNFVFSIGRRRVAWGQFELVSPMNFVLPLTPQTAELTSGKIDFVVPQDQISLSWFSERVEFQMYYFFTTQIDWLVEDVLEGESIDQIFTRVTSTMTVSDVAVDSEDFEKHEQYALRLLFYADWGTIGLTYHKGRDTLIFDSRLATLHCDNRMSVATTACEPHQAINLRRHVDLSETENFGVEMAFPTGDWVVKFEILFQETVADLEGFTVTDGNVNSPARVYLNNIIANNDGELFMPVDRTVMAIGADADKDKWRFNLALTYIDEQLNGDNASEIMEMEDQLFGIDRGSVVFPTMNIARYIGGDKRQEVGFLGGFLGAYAGFSVYYKGAVGDNFSWTLGGEAIRSLRDDLLAETGGDDPNIDYNRYEIADDFSVGLRLSFVYNF